MRPKIKSGADGHKRKDKKLKEKFEKKKKEDAANANRFKRNISFCVFKSPKPEFFKCAVTYKDYTGYPIGDDSSKRKQTDFKKQLLPKHGLKTNLLNQKVEAAEKDKGPPMLFHQKSTE